MPESTVSIFPGTERKQHGITRPLKAVSDADTERTEKCSRPSQEESAGRGDSGASSAENALRPEIQP
ncbi:ParB family protein, partial [Escherichia coli]